MAITLYCSGCKIKVATIEKGSMIMCDAVMLCPACERLRKISDMGNKTQKNSYGDFSDIFNTMFGGRK